MKNNPPEETEQEKPNSDSIPSPKETESSGLTEAKDLQQTAEPEASDAAETPKETLREVSEADLDRCYGTIEPILGMGLAADWDEEDLNDSDTPDLVDREAASRIATKNKVLGIDIGETSIKLVQLGPKQAILTMDVMPLDTEEGPQEREQSIIHALQQMIKHNKIKTRKAVLCLSEKCSYMRSAQLSGRNKAEMQKALAQEAGKLELPGEQGQYVFNHMVSHMVSHTTPERESGDPKPGKPEASALRALFFATEQKAILRILRIAKAAKLKPIAIDIDALAATRFYIQAYQSATEDATILAEMHASNTLLSFVEGDRLVWAKHLSTGSHDFTTSIAKALRIDAAEAEKLKQGEWKTTASFQNQKSDVIRAIEPVLNRLSGEIRRTVQFYLSQDKTRNIHRLVLAGSGSRIPGLAKDLTRLLEIPVVRWGHTSLFNFSSVLPDANTLPDQLSRFAICLGLCLWNKNADPLNLLPGVWTRYALLKSRKEEPRVRARKINIGMPGLPTGWRSLIGGLLALLILGSGVLFYTQKQGLKVRLEKEREMMQDWDALREEMSHLRALRKAIEEKTTQVEGLRRQQVRLAKGMAAMSAAVPRTVALTAVDFEEGAFKLSAYTVHTHAVETFIDRLMKTDYFSEPELKLIRKTQDHPGKAIYFELKFGLNDQLS